MFFKDCMLNKKIRSRVRKEIIVIYLLSIVIFGIVKLAFESCFLAIIITETFNLNMIIKCITKALEQSLYIDSLTGLFLKEKLFSDMKKLINNKEIFYVVFIDINGFKLLNDTKGHEVGDKLLKEFANNIRNIDEDLIPYRYGGDEFVCLITGENIDIKLERLKEYRLQTISHINFSYGIVHVNDDCYRSLSIDSRIRAIIELADSRMYEQKKMFKKLKL